MNDATSLARKVGAKRVAKHADAQRAKGLARVAVWVPVADKDRLIAYATGLRVGADLLLPSDRQMAAILRYGSIPPPASERPPSGHTSKQSADNQPPPKKSQKKRRQRHKKKQREKNSRKS